MNTFNPNGPINSIAAAANSNAAVGVALQVASADNVPNQQVKITNTDTTNDAVVGWGQTAVLAAFNALATNQSPNCTFILHNTSEVITVPSNAFFTAILVAGTPTIKVQAGIALKG